MTIAIDCDDCEKEVVFLIESQEKNPREICDCGAVYELKVRRLGTTHPN